MPKEYRTIQEVAGPLMMVKGVEGVAFDELGEIELASGETRRCKVLEVDGDTVVVDNEEMLLNVLQKILSSKEVHQVLKGLLTIAKKEKESVYCPFD